MGNSAEVHILIVAKRPTPGRAKTRLIPAFGEAGAAALAAAALADTFEAAASCRATRVLVAFDGDPSGIVPSDFEVVPQRSGDFADRLEGAWADLGGAGLQIGMDTPQVTASELDDAFDLLNLPGNDAVMGPAVDGGWWALGLHRPQPGLFVGIAMSRTDTGMHQLGRLHDLGLSTSLLPVRRDVDEPEDVAIVAREAPWTRFAAVADDLLPHTRRSAR